MGMPIYLRVSRLEYKTDFRRGDENETEMKRNEMNRRMKYNTKGKQNI